MSATCDAKAVPAIGFFERYLTAWVALCILVGIGLGQGLPDLFKAIGAMEVAQGQPAGGAADLGDDHPHAAQESTLVPCIR